MFSLIRQYKTPKGLVLVDLSKCSSIFVDLSKKTLNFTVNSFVPITSVKFDNYSQVSDEFNSIRKSLIENSKCKNKDCN